MTTSIPNSTSKSSGDCRCNKECGCCTRKALAAAAASATSPITLNEEPKLGFLAARPWLWVIVAFLIMLTAWSVMFTLAVKNQPENVELVTAKK